LIDGTSGFPLGGQAMPLLEPASNATDIANILFIGTLLACIVSSVAVAWFVNRRDGIDRGAPPSGVGGTEPMTSVDGRSNWVIGV
jgi:hypothetical protein